MCHANQLVFTNKLVKANLLRQPQVCSMLHARPSPGSGDQFAEDRAAFNARRKPGDMRRWTGIGVDTYRPLQASEAFAKMTK